MTARDRTPMLPADTIVVCRPEQMRAAATVLSCIAADRLPPLFVVEHPPCSEARYRALYARYRRMCDRRDEALGTIAARAAWLGRPKAPAGVAAWSNEEIDRRAKALTAYRRWIKRHRLLGDLFRTLPLQRAVVLFDATPNDTSTIDPFAGVAHDSERRSMLAAGLDLVRLPVDADEPLWQRAWQLLRPGESMPSAALEVVAHPVALIAGLHRARRLGMPLHVVDGAAPSGCLLERPIGAAAVEAVVVEADDRADLLTAVFYALRQNAVLCVRPRVSVRAIELARRAVADWYADERSAQDGPPIAALEAAVARAVPQAVIDAVGDLPLTAWTAGVPYHLLKTAHVDWSGKPIGLMTDDPLLLASVDMYAPAGRPGAPPRQAVADVAVGDSRAASRLHMVFDPGDFATDETAAVLRALDADPGCVLLAQGAAASHAALIAAGGAPLELLYFNTHGDRDAIELDDMAMPGYKLLQRVTLGSHPLVFNNSCQSWTGVGREFLIAGARAYIGTLWPVRADAAARIADATMRRLTAGGETVAASLRGNGLDPTTEQAYVVAGPISTRLRPPDTSFADERSHRLADASLLCEMGLFLCRQGKSPDAPFVAPVMATLVVRSEALAADIDARWPDPDSGTLSLLTLRLELATAFRFDVEANVRRCVALATRGLKVVGAANDTATVDMESKAAFWLACSRVSRKLERWAEMVALLTASIDAQSRAGRAVVDELLDRCDAFQKLGQVERALADARQAHAAFTALSESAVDKQHARRGAMLAAGRLAGLYRGAGQLDAALAAMREGYRVAVAIGDLSEQAAFKIDESGILRDGGDPTGAIAAAEAGLAAVRQGHDDAAELRVLGALTLSLRADAQWERARLAAEDGLAAARRQGQAGSAVSFLCDLSAVAEASGDAVGACARLVEAAAIAAVTGAANQARRILNESEALLGRLRHWPALRSALKVTFAVIGALPPQERSSACTLAMTRLLTRVAATGWAAARDPLWRMSRELAQIGDAQGDGMVQQGRFLLDVVAACYARSKGLDETARAEAARLDALSTGAFGLVAFMNGGRAEVAPQEHPAWTAARATASAA